MLPHRSTRLGFRRRPPAARRETKFVLRFGYDEEGLKHMCTALSRLESSPVWPEPKLCSVQTAL